MMASGMEKVTKQKKAVVLLSGGLDSTTVLAVANREGYKCYCLSFDYGQRQGIELERARENAARAGAAEHLVLRVDLDKIGGSALTGAIPVPKNRSYAEMESAVPVTYVPGRNTIFLSYALAWAEVVGADDIFIGINALDYSGYPDCRPAFLRAFEQLANLATRAGIEDGRRFTVHAPLMNLTKKGIIALGLSLGVDYATTHSCYDPDAQGRACGVCDACRLRLKGFSEAGLADPIIYQSIKQG
jgi:7-cyano-7-deazaguanine synthase